MLFRSALVAKIGDSLALIKEIIDGKFNDGRDGPNYRLQHIDEILISARAAHASAPEAWKGDKKENPNE